MWYAILGHAQNQIVGYYLLYTSSGWWFATFVIFPNSWDDDPIWQIFFRGVETTNQPCISHYYIPKNSFPKLCLPLPSVKRENFMPHHPVFQCSFLGQPWCMANVAGWKKNRTTWNGTISYHWGYSNPISHIIDNRNLTSYDHTLQFWEFPLPCLITGG